MNQKRLFFCGIGGSGMSALAMYCKHLGFEVCGSDRNHDQGRFTDFYKKIESFGISLYPQNGSGVTTEISKVIASSAVEEKIPDIKTAKDISVPIQLRAELLAELFNRKKGIAIAGTSGKSTTTAMVAHILRVLGKDPNVINGAVMLNATEKDGLGNTYFGKSDFLVIEADESDGSIRNYNPDIGVVNNISFDHKPLIELRTLFSDFLTRCKTGVVLNLDNEETSKMISIHPNTMTFSLNNKEADLYAENISHNGFESSFTVQKNKVVLMVGGNYNIENALAALCVARLLNLDIGKACHALESFRGTKRRMQNLGVTKSNIIVIDDFAHNADKIGASLDMLQNLKKPLHIIFQPHGFTPTLQQKDDLIDVFSQKMEEKDYLYIPEIYFAGGTVEKKISSKDLTDNIRKNQRNVLFFDTREEIRHALKNHVKKDSIVVVMGARDDSLTDFANAILTDLGRQ